MLKLEESIITGIEAVITPEKYLICALIAFLCGIIISLTHAYKNRSNTALHGVLTFLPIVIIVMNLN